jgi:hypothetical protein
LPWRPPQSVEVIDTRGRARHAERA